MTDMGWVRQPVVADRFYPGHPLQLRKAVENLLVREKELKKASMLMVPHAGYMFSGATAGKTFSCSDMPARLFVLGPNHTGTGAPVSVWARGSWITPLGEMPVDVELAAALLGEDSPAAEDRGAHLREHSIEVELPFLQVRYEGARFVPVCVGTGRLNDLEALGKALAAAVTAAGGEAGLVVSSDMNHYEDAEASRSKDEAALEALLRLDPEGLYATVLDKDVSMCGFCPAVAALFALRELGSFRCELVDYTHSGMVTGDSSEVVSYAGARAWRG